ncbi:MAG TPA: hypothetical protein DCZ95_09430 [Verrucomicrobia bacterium]|nr:MAG: hypothetical protein A2X46_06305 [Lentisphaerae bacterium GWF2_57_35]HBA84300.1 hypothetical protein [Verrucomicrobiota bacterium]
MHPDTAATADGDGAPSLPFFAVGRALDPLSAFFFPYNLWQYQDAPMTAQSPFPDDRSTDGGANSQVLALFL